METNYYPYQKGADGYFHLGPNTFGSIRTNCLRTGILYEDAEFPPSHYSIFGGSSNSNEIRWQGNILWKRPLELVKDPQFIADGVSRFDVIQGELGNCWFIAAVANMSMHQGLFAQVVPFDNGTFRPGEYCGAFHFRFWQYGHWIDIIIDDRLPCNRRGELLFLHSSDSREFWSALLEKAYAKLHGSYTSLSGGTPSEALQDFSGGIIEAIDIDLKTTNLFNHMRKAYTRSSLMSCSLSAQGVRSEERTKEGLVKGHAYSVTAVEVMPLNQGYHSAGRSGAPLIRIRNPWGDNFEWKGAWSDNSREWNLVNPAVRAQLGVMNRSDGEFWMHIDDFQKQFTRLEICHLSPDPIDSGVKEYGKPWNKEMIYGSWVRGISAGGCLNQRTFAENPQYFFHFEASAEDGAADKCTVIIGLLQKRPKRVTTNAVTRKAQCIGFRMYKVNAYYRPGEKLDLSFFKRSGTETFTSGDFIDSREVSARFEVTTGNYCLVPSTFEPNEEGEFLLRIFSEPSNRPPPPRYTVQQYASQHGGTIDGFQNLSLESNQTTGHNYPMPSVAPGLGQSYSPSLPISQPPNLNPSGIVNFPNPYANPTIPPPMTPTTSNVPYPITASNVPGYPPVNSPAYPYPSQAPIFPQAPPPPQFQSGNAYPYPYSPVPPNPAQQSNPTNIGFVFGQNPF